MFYIKRYESYTISSTKQKDETTRNYFFTTDKFEYKIGISKYVDGYWSIGFKAKKDDDYFYDHEIIANENPYKIMDTVVKVAKDFYLKEIKEIEDIKKKFNLTDKELNPKEIIKGFVFSFSGDKDKNLQRLNLYKRYFDKFGMETEFSNKGNIYYLQIK